MINPERVKILNTAEVRPGGYGLHRKKSSERVERQPAFRSKSEVLTGGHS
jgi:hypothetical protein